MSAVEVAAGLAVLAGALLQSAVGFGFALIAAPLVFAAMAPEHAVWLLMLLGVEVNVLTLATEGRRPRPLGRVAAVVVGCALPGMALGVAVLRAVDKTTLQVAVTALVFASLAVQRWARRHEAVRPAPSWAAPVTGLAAGALTTSTTTAGPPIILLLRGRGWEPGRIRDTLTVVFLGLGILGALVLAAGGADPPGAAAFAALVPVVAAGHLLGRPVFARLAAGSYEAVLTGVLTASALAGLAVALL